MKLLKIWIVFFILVLLGLIVFGIRENEALPGIIDKPKIFAHRGAINSFNESTITSYKIAAKNGVDALELDLRMTKDNVLIIMHDETIDRTTNGKGKVNDLSLEEIKKYETIGKYNGKTTKEDIPTLEELFQTFGDTQRYYIETRLVNGEAIMEEPLVQLLKNYNLLKKEKVAIQSFSEKSLEKMAKLAPDLRLTLLFKKGKFDLNKALSVDYPVIGLESSDASIKTINALHKQGKEVHVFFHNVESIEAQQEKMRELNVDGFFY
ncbi:glycerophosphodiester phosphodiesterase family protein [Lysinibacillus telephonicus]|uniref:Glycerophosphodiester phosphodiesterase n=1 Tax=Lysinibacillus telephonicus TaxID=1714840 RepID=A0A431UXG8_9BACI|nr:glycerophosphodiester phosphodiesterase family protein [Lysinibacillus telephonicus]RTQ96472.1 glycerophosphodiester phosphodiesterase [Lysinibacillus telephonicus]